MIRTGHEHRESIRDRREVWVDGEKVSDVTTHPALRPIIDARARIYDLAHEDATREIMTYVDAESGERCPVGAKPRSPRRTGTRSGPPSRPSSTI
jgi:4-hydroxyphenylacetate 3-monooxygenase